MKKFFTFLFATLALHSAEVTKSGLVPTYNPSSNHSVFLFLPYNPKVFIAGENLHQLTKQTLSRFPHAELIYLTPLLKEIKQVEKYPICQDNIKKYHGVLGKASQIVPYYESNDILNKNTIETYLPGSILKPSSTKFVQLFGREKQIQQYPVKNLLPSNQQLQLIVLNAGGKELDYLKLLEEQLDNVIAVRIKTYHTSIRKSQSDFNQIYSFLSRKDFWLFTHYIYDSSLGEAVFIKRKYFRGVFQNKEI
ncbi:MAG: hypothetical protein MRY21_02400 [Simkaniaceae bacterium]|nr:hypothetical protein [Simkaniaceae bacterium]